MSDNSSGKKKGAKLDRYVELTDKIRDLSSPQMREIGNAADYHVRLLENFMRIGEMAKENVALLKAYYDPFIAAGDLTQEQISEMKAFTDALMNAYVIDWLDAPLVYAQARRLLKDAMKNGGDEERIRALDGFLMASYSMVHMTLRLYPVSDMFISIRNEGLAAGAELIAYLDPERFEKLDQESREKVVIDARYIRAIFERADRRGDEETNESDLQILRNALALAEDPYYRERMPGYNWEYHIYRTLDYMSTLTEMNNEQGFNARQLAEINTAAKRQLALWYSDEAFFSRFDARRDLELVRLRNGYLTGGMDLRSYQDALLELEKQQSDDDYSALNNLIAISVPLEYILLLDRDHLTEAEQRYLIDYYNRLINHMHRMPKKGSLSFILTYMMNILTNYIEVPGGMGFEAFGLHLMAALHPPTYIHTLSVAAISRCLVRHLLKRAPELFTDLPGYSTVSKVKRNAGRIAVFAYHAALCHDFGKLAIIETIMTYGRNLFDVEFEIIRAHPGVGASLLARFPSTEAYADIAAGHHRWFDNSGGYPDDFDVEASPYRTIIAVISCADCLDAATDSVGRSYKEGKALDRYIDEVHEQSGTRYAPFLDELLDDKEVRAELAALISEGRGENYRKAYHILKEHGG